MAVEAPAVDLDDEPVIGPVEVDLAPARHAVGRGARQVGSRHRPQEAPLELGARRGDAVARQPREPRAAATALLRELVGADQAEHERLAACALELGVGAGRGEVAERADRRRDGQAVESRCLHARRAVKHQARAVTGVRLRGGDLDERRQ